jgi:hypothetical protein
VITDGENYEKFVNATYSKTFSPRQVLPHVVMKYIKPTDKVLDFGAGKDAFGAKILRENGFNCTAWDIGKNFNSEVHDPRAMHNEYDVVFASNVFNVQPDGNYITEILLDVQGILKNEGLFFCNFPKSPRKNKWDTNMLESTLRLFAHTHNNYGGKVERVGENIWKCEYRM